MGGGVNGCRVARDASGRGFSVHLCVEWAWAECAEDLVWRRAKLELPLSADAIAALDRFIAGRFAEGGRRLSAQRTPA